ncbi:sulfotransferase family 2 domain-containing protein [Glaciecola sp. SC05]|uniref:sulfotransferase family 2 domain-containing protein n=1 Tax=Glaciecola sp. SC05 TaxID=1987355 RepID=UPI003529BF5F
MKNKIIQFLPIKLYLYLRWYDFKFNRRSSFDKVQGLRHVDDEVTGGYEPFDRAKAIFVHVPKCAGISVNKALFKSIAGGHTTLDEYINVFPPTLLQSYFKFTFVRNPWDRVVSAYSFLQQGGLNQWDKEFYENELKEYGSFKAFIHHWLKPENLMKHHHFKPQHHYLIDKYNKISVDYIGYFESIEDDFTHIANKMNLNTELKKHNAAQRIDYREYYDEETKAIVGNIYAKDIEMLNYTFDGIDRPVRTINL